ncbi:MAG: hypothetical protein MUC48_27170 [Leptolyngbya sp. Prado105]|jgi:hypothetical protein|nr:hypothetical protein [Leptolyngbya sp. Prado105]
MSGDEQPNLLDLTDSSHLPQTITETIEYLSSIVLKQFNREAIEKQLFYHNEIHIRAVQRRSQQIFAVVAPALSSSLDLSRTQLLLDFCAIAHDMVQQFDATPEIHTARQRKPGISEMITIEQLIHLIRQLNDQLDQQNSTAKLTDADIAVIQQAITATICTYHGQEQAIYQPLLYAGEPLSIVSRILALADLGTLGMDGIEAYNHEGSLLFLEENPDVVPLLQEKTIQHLESTNPDLAENIRKRLLKRCHFQVNFAKSRLLRLNQELQGLPETTIPVLRTEVFQYLSPSTIVTITTTTPTSPDTPLEVLLQFFQLEQYLSDGK